MSDPDDPFFSPYDPAPQREEDLWFLPAPPEDAALPPLPRASGDERALVPAWTRAEATQAARLARTSAAVGALDDRLSQAPEGWRHRLALLEVAELSWRDGTRISPERLALWAALRLSSAQEDAQALARAGWAQRRLAGGPGPEAGLAAFLNLQGEGGADALPERLAGWADLMAEADALHPLSRAAMGYHLWPLPEAGGAFLEGAVTCARVAAGEARGGLVFVPLGGAGGRHVQGLPEARLHHWLEAVQAATLGALRHLERLQVWDAQARAAIAGLSGRTPAQLLDVLRDWPLVSAPMAERLTDASRAAVQRNLARLETLGLIREVTGQGRYRFWTARL